MKARRVIGTALVGLVAATMGWLATRPAASPLTSIKLVTLPNQQRAVEFRLKNSFHRNVGFYLYRQQFFRDHWAPENPKRYRPDETIWVDPGKEVTVTLKAYPEGGRYRFQIAYASPPPSWRLLRAWLARKVGWQRQYVSWKSETLLTEEIEVPPL